MNKNSLLSFGFRCFNMPQLPCRFEINFKTGQAKNDDTAFHFNPRFNANVVMNSFRNGAWEVEEYGPDNPFKMGEAFEMFIVIKPEGYQVCALSHQTHKTPETQLRSCTHTDLLALLHQVYVNGREYYLFKHRIPLEKVTALNICGNVAVNLFAFIRVSTFF
ncbi:MAG: hypothetical protein ACRCVE_12180 [Plesiomonas sp.]